VERKIAVAGTFRVVLVVEETEIEKPKKNKARRKNSTYECLRGELSAERPIEKTEWKREDDKKANVGQANRQTKGKEKIQEIGKSGGECDACRTANSHDEKEIKCIM
jgi:general stress protein YciG